jgi:hypothetical protein
VDRHKGRPLRLDADAASANRSLPGFLARPEGAPVYHGFPILDDIEVDGFRLGMITDWEAEPADSGDAFIIAPDDSRAGLVWEVGPEPRVEQVLEQEARRWGVWQVTFPHPMTSRENARLNLAAALQDCDRNGRYGRRLSGGRRPRVLPPGVCVTNLVRGSAGASAYNLSRAPAPRVSQSGLGVFRSPAGSDIPSYEVPPSKRLVPSM